MSVIIQTTIGEFVIDLLVDKCPKSSANFLKLAKLKYYHWTCCHSLQTDFVASFGDPTETGKGGECAEYLIDRECAMNRKSKLFHPEIKKDLYHDKIGFIFV
jgi:peptidyl-prolyl cis-trans isomerase-like 4